MAIFVVDSTIHAAPETVFDAMADARNEPQWNSRVSQSRLLTDEPIGANSMFETVNRGQTYTATVSTYERPKRLVFDVTGKGMAITATFDYTASGENTASHATFDFRPTGMLKVFFPMMKPLVAKDGPKQAQNFARFVESRPPTG
jgi:uncharacterized protein YndB with AHSA1/START domain